MTMPGVLDFTQATVETRGRIDKVAIEGSTLEVEGHVCVFEPLVPTGFSMSVGGVELPEVIFEFGLPTPQVFGYWPQLPGSDRAGYRITATIPSTARKTHGLVAVRSLYGEAAGRLQTHVVNPLLPLPPEEYQNGIGGYFTEVAFDFLSYCIELGHLQPTYSVLDAGCGVGRMAYALAAYLAPEAVYEGFDIVKQWIQWSQQEISSVYKNFHFRMVDIYNHHYNPHGRVLPAKFIFPYQPGSFDFALLTSVFTHMRAAELRHYLRQLHTSLKVGGTCLCTAFILDEQAQSLIESGRSSLNMRHPVDEGFTSNPEMPEYAIGYPEQRLLDWIRQAGFEVEQIFYGNWCRRAHFTSYQDILILRRM